MITWGDDRTSRGYPVGLVATDERGHTVGRVAWTPTGWHGWTTDPPVSCGMHQTRDEARDAVDAALKEGATIGDG